MQLGLFLTVINIYYLFTSCVSEDMWERYGEAFNKIWAASAFKGITILNTFLLIYIVHSFRFYLVISHVRHIYMQLSKYCLSLCQSNSV